MKICPRTPLRVQIYQKMRPTYFFLVAFSDWVVSLRSGGNTCACVTFPFTRCGTLTRCNESRFGKRS